MVYVLSISSSKLLLLSLVILLCTRSNAASYRDYEYSAERRYRQYQYVRYGKGYTPKPTVSPSPPPTLLPSVSSSSPPSSHPSLSPSYSSSPSSQPFSPPSSSPSLRPSVRVTLSPEASPSENNNSNPAANPSDNSNPVANVPSETNNTTGEGSETSSEEAGETETITIDGKTSSGKISGMIVGIVAITTIFGFIYQQARRRENSRNKGYHVSEFYNNNDDYDEDANPIESWGYDSPTRSLGLIAAGSAHRDNAGKYGKVASSSSSSSNWLWMNTSMSKLAAGATQEEFSQNGMNIDIYGRRLKKKKGSPTTNAKKGSALDTNLDPIVEVNSSLASSITNQTDDKAVKNNLNVPQLLPALSVSSCPSDENSFRGGKFSPVGPPALSALSPDPLMDELMSPCDDTTASKTLQEFTQAMDNSYDGSPVRKLNFVASDTESDLLSDKSSDSGVQALMTCENRVVMSEEDAVKASLISFVDDENIHNSCPHDEIEQNEMTRKTLGSASDFEANKDNYDESIRKTLGCPSDCDVSSDEDENKENSPPINASGDDCNATILVLSAKNREIEET